MFKLAIANVIDVPIKFKVQDGGATKQHAFTLLGKRLSQEAVREIAADDSTTVREFLLANVTGWRGQRLVLDENEQPAPYSPEAFECLLSLAGMELIAYRAYLTANVLADSAEGRAGK